jgi:hypothetical protein
LEAPTEASRNIDLPLAAKLGTVSVVGPPGAQVELDGVVAGSTPLAPFQVPPGRHTVWATKRGYEIFAFDVVVVEDQTVEVTLELTPIPLPP